MKRVVVWDPDEGYAEGEVVDGNVAYQLVATRRVAVLPVEPDLLLINAQSGFVVHHYGSGYAYDPAMPRIGSPIVLYMNPDYPYLNWAARLTVRGIVASAQRGALKFAADTGQRGTVLASGISEYAAAPHLETLGIPDAHGGWTIYGRSRCNARLEGFTGFGLFGTLSGARVQWFALTQTTAPE